MFVSNWYKLLRLNMCGVNPAPAVLTYSGSACEFTSYPSMIPTSFSIGKTMSDKVTLSSFASGDYSGRNLLMAGTSDAPFSSSHYTLPGVIETGLTHISTGCVSSCYADKLTVSLSRTFQNTSGSTVTVKELGLYECCVTGYVILLARDILETPVTVENGKTFTVTMNIELT